MLSKQVAGVLRGQLEVEVNRMHVLSYTHRKSGSLSSVFTSLFIYRKNNNQLRFFIVDGYGRRTIQTSSLFQTLPTGTTLLTA